MDNNLSQVSSKYTPAKDTFALILVGGRDSRLHELMDKRVKLTLRFGGNRRIINFVLSNYINSGPSHIGVITQCAVHPLLRYLQKGWSFPSQGRRELIGMLPAR